MATRLASLPGNACGTGVKRNAKQSGAFLSYAARNENPNQVHGSRVKTRIRCKERQEKFRRVKLGFRTGMPVRTVPVTGILWGERDIPDAFIAVGEGKLTHCVLFLPNEAGIHCAEHTGNKGVGVAFPDIFQERRLC